MKNLLNLISFPFILTVALSIHFGLIKYTHLPLVLVSLVTFYISSILIVGLERVRPYRVDWNKNLGDLKTDLIQTIIILPLSVQPVLMFYQYLQKKFSVHIWPSTWPFLVKAIVIILVAELLFYGYHRFSHTNKFLLKYHCVHHGVQRIYSANSGRFHFVDTFFQSLFYLIPTFLLGADENIIILFLTLNAITGVLEHANFELKNIFISRIFNTAELHRIHHSVKMNECNSNYGKILSVWDTVFGTYNKPKFERVNLEVGLPFGRAVPHDLMGQFRYPFVKKKEQP
jgi:sterol desaturase/sphingolipid hydroxylase (fatty acid hydroxylase superfamily)